MSSVCYINYSDIVVVAAPQKTDAAEAWGLLWEIMLGARALFVTAMSEIDLTPVQGIVLRRLDPEHPTAMNELAEALSCDASNVTGLVDRLEARGLLERRAAPGDRRVKTLVLTPAGIDLRVRVIDRMREPPEGVARLSKSDQRQLRDILRRAIASSS